MAMLDRLKVKATFSVPPGDGFMQLGAAPYRAVNMQQHKTIHDRTDPHGLIEIMVLENFEKRAYQVTITKIRKEGPQRFITMIPEDFIRRENFNTEQLMYAIERMFNDGLDCQRVIEAITEVVQGRDKITLKVEEIFDKLKAQAKEEIKNGNA